MIAEAAVCLQAQGIDDNGGVGGGILDRGLSNNGGCVGGRRGIDDVSEVLKTMTEVAGA